MIETVFTLALVIQLVTPGVVFSRVRRRFFVFDGEAQAQENLLNYFVLSLTMLAITWPLFATFGGFDPIGALIIAKDAVAFLGEINSHPIRWLLQLIVSPALAAVLWAYIERKAWGDGLFTKMGLPPHPRHPNAIQAALWAHRKSNPVIEVLLKDKVTKIVGVWATNSSASLNKGWPDLFLSAVYRPTSDGRWVLDDDCTGIYIPGSEIRIAQFFKNEVETPPPTENNATMTAPDTSNPANLSYLEDRRPTADKVVKDTAIPNRDDIA